MNRARQRIIVVEQMINSLNANERETMDKYNVHKLDRYDDPSFDISAQKAPDAIANLEKKRDVNMKVVENKYALFVKATADKAEKTDQRLIAQISQALQVIRAVNFNSRVQRQTEKRLIIEQSFAQSQMN